LKIGPINSFFLFCSGTSKDIISKCPSFEIIKYSTIGVTIILTSLLALLSGFYALSIIFDNIYISIVGSIFWSIIIFNLDRYIVISMRPTKSLSNNLIISLPRFFIAIVVAVVISKPIEIKLFENEINNFLELETLNRLELVDKKIDQKLDEIQIRKDKIELAFQKKVDIVNGYKEDYLCEGSGTCGTMIRGRGIEFQARKERWVNESAKLNLEKIKKDSIIKGLIEYEKKMISNLSEEKNVIKSTNYGFFDRVDALNSVNATASYFILFIFIMIETSPMLTKILARKGPYDLLVMKTEFQFESDFLNESDSLKILRDKNEKINQMNADVDLNTRKKLIENINAQDAFSRYENLKDDEVN